MTSEYRAFRGVWIPAEIWLSPDMTLQEKVMLVEINSLQHPERGCFKSNRQFAEFFQLSVSRVSEIISSLAKKGSIRVEHVTDGPRVAERRIFMATPFGIPKPPLRNPEAPPSGKAKESNTVLGVHLRGEKARAALAVRPDDVDPQTWTDFLAMRKAKRAPLTPTALAGLQREATKARMTLQAALRMCCERGWQSFRAAWMVEKPKFASGGVIGYASDEVD